MTQKRVAAIHDISGFGKCSLTVALPILSAAGIETAVIPTAVLSTHTGGFSDYTFCDLTDQLLPIAQHWRRLGLHFDGVYTGYLGSARQIDLVLQAFDLLRGADTMLLVDPAMADGGRLYAGFADDFPRQMRRLAQRADLLVPNITEACLLTDTPYRDGPYRKEYIETLLQKLAALGAAQVVLTGVFFDREQLGAAAYTAATGEIHYALTHRMDGFYHGTGDVFASALLAAVQNGFTLSEAADIAAEFTAGAISRTRAAGIDLRFGVQFEPELPWLIQRLGL